MKFFLQLALIVILLFQAQIIKANNATLLMAAGTTIVDTGLLDSLVSKFKKDTNYRLLYSSVGSNEALVMGENGDVSLVFTHAKKYEENFIKKGFGLKRIPVMYNHFIIVGPSGIVKNSNDTRKIFTEIYEKNLPFISRGDNSGTHEMEKKIWQKLKIDPTKNPNYLESGNGMGATLIIANEKKAYTLIDKGTWLKFSKNSDILMELAIISENYSLKNEYSIIAVNPKKYPQTNIDVANSFIDWIISDKTQKMIGEFGRKKYGQALYIPNADK